LKYFRCRLEFLGCSGPSGKGFRVFHMRNCHG
jgi:hypothetical protein